MQSNNINSNNSGEVKGMSNGVEYKLYNVDVLVKYSIESEIGYY